MKQEACINKEHFKNALNLVGLSSGMTVLTHSSLSAFGFVEGGADTVIDAIIEVVGEKGTVIMPTYSINRRQLNDTSEEILSYDPQTTPAWTGIITESFRKRQGAIRSNHPTHSLAAIGPKAKKMIQSTDRIYRENGYILLAGVGLESNSTMHIGEKIASPRQYLERIQATRPSNARDRILYAMSLHLSSLEMSMPLFGNLLDIGRQIMHRHMKHEQKIVNHSPSGPWANLAKMETIYRESGVMKEAVIGYSKISLLQAKPMVDLFAQELRRNPEYYYSYRLSTYDRYLQRKSNGKSHEQL